MNLEKSKAETVDREREKHAGRSLQEGFPLFLLWAPLCTVEMACTERALHPVVEGQQVCPFEGTLCSVAGLDGSAWSLRQRKAKDTASLRLLSTEKWSAVSGQHGGPQLLLHQMSRPLQEKVGTYLVPHLLPASVSSFVR